MKRLLLSLFCVAFSQMILAHGENMRGPHGGFIRMPGAFHTEVVPEKDDLAILLLDVGFKNPIVKNSYVNASIQTAHRTRVLKCRVDRYRFICPITRAELNNKGELKLVAKRDNAPEATAIYPLPLHRE